MIILNPDADEEQQQEILERVQQLITDGGGTVEHVNDWGRKKITYPMEKHPDGRYVVITCTGEPTSLAEIERILAINKGVVLRALFIRLNRGRGRAGPRQRRARCRWTRTPRASRPAARRPRRRAGAAAAAAGPR